MKQFDDILPKPDKINIVDQRQVEYEKKFLGSTVRHNGHTMYEIDCSTGEITEAEYEEENIVMVENKNLITDETMTPSAKIVRDIKCKENCVYIASLNKKTAQKKYANWLIGTAIQKKKNK